MGGVAGERRILDLIEGVLDVRLDGHVPASMWVWFRYVTGVNSEDCFHVQVFGPFQKFEETKSVGGTIAPATGRDAGTAVETA